MAGSKQVRLRVGVIGLGRLWEARHKPALARMKDRFRVVAVYDQVARRAEIEAAQLGCRAVDGLTAPDRAGADVDAVYLLTPQWFGLHPIEVACAARQADLLRLPLAGERRGARRLDATGPVERRPVHARVRPPVLPGHAPAPRAAGDHARPARLVVGQGRLFGFDRYGQPGPSTQIAPAPLADRPGELPARLVPVRLPGRADGRPGLGGTVLPGAGRGRRRITRRSCSNSPAGRSAQVSVGRYHRAAWGDASRFLPQPGIQVFAERGVAWLEMPDRIQWTDAEGTHEERLPLEPSDRRDAQRPVPPPGPRRAVPGPDLGRRDRRRPPDRRRSDGAAGKAAGSPSIPTELDPNGRDR